MGRGKSKARADTEKRRALLAKRLHKWLNANGSKIPSTAAGIERHKALVAEYEQMFGPSSVGDRKARARMYKAILDSIERKAPPGATGQRSKVVAAEKKKADAKLRAKNRAAKEKRDAARAQAEAVRDRRNPAGKGKVTTATGFDWRNGGSPASEKDVMSDEVAGILSGDPSYRSVVKANDRAKELLAIFRKNLAVYEAKLAALQL